MKKNQKHIIFWLIMLAVVLIGYTQYKAEYWPEKPIGGEKDEYGCLIAAGYSWCPSTEKCQRMWEEFCPEYADVFRIRNFEDCVEAGNPVMESYPRQCRANGKTFVEQIPEPVNAEDFCVDEDIAEVYQCDEFIRVVSKVPGKGTTIYREDGSELSCPVVAPQHVTEECSRISIARCITVCIEGECRDEDYGCTPMGPPCCAGLMPVADAVETKEGCAVATCGSICLPCGNGVCDDNENRCSCPEDCGKMDIPCQPEMRDADYCIAEYRPVCGFKADGSSQTYSNMCNACKNAGVAYFQEGECAG